MTGRLEHLTAGMAIPYGGDRLAVVDEALADAFRPGDRLVVVQESGALLRIPAAAHVRAKAAVDEAVEAFGAVAGAPADRIERFFHAFADRLEDPAIWRAVRTANEADVAAARARGANFGRLLAGEKMRADMIAGLRGWAQARDGRGRLVERAEHAGWSVELATAPLGVVGFVFEGRPNVLADAAGVIRGGNTVVFRIGADALGTARAMMAQALQPALAAAGLPRGAAGLIDEADRAAGWALFSDPRLALAVARGSGPAVAQLGAIARQAGTPVSLHGTGGAWLVADETADAERFAAVVGASLDRKVCNTLNVCCLTRAAASRLIPVFLQALPDPVILHAAPGAQSFLPTGNHAQPCALEDLAREWEWDATPELTLALADNLAEAIALFNRFSPRFAASLISQDAEAQARFWREIDAPFVGDGFTRWVDGQYALGRPELGLSNWQAGRLFARGGVLSGDGVYTIRARMRQSDPALHR